MVSKKCYREFGLAFNCFQKIGPVRLKRLENYFPNLAEAFTASAGHLEQAGLEPKLVSDFTVWRQSFSLEEVLESLKKENIDYITWHDDAYPRLLAELPAPPPLLYYKGDLSALAAQTNRLAVVGSREHSAYGERVINDLLLPVIGAGVSIVSGLALGVDALAHQCALNNHGITLAVLGSGLGAKHIYPPLNRALADHIVKAGGLILSEFPLKTPPLRQNFPQRNRIISGLCQATLVVEAKKKSGSLITAACALDQNRDVLAVPGNIFSEYSLGPSQLIQAGAKAILNSNDILEIYGPTIEAPKTRNAQTLFPVFRALNQTEKIVYELIRAATEMGQRIGTDEIVKKSKLDTASINSTLSILEIRNIVACDERGYEIKN